MVFKKSEKQKKNKIFFSLIQIDSILYLYLQKKKEKC